MSPYKEIDHTADIGLCITAGDLNSLFLDAAAGMLSLVFGERLPCEEHTSVGGGARNFEDVKIDINASSLEGLLVKWLEELLYLIEVRHVRPEVMDLKVSKDSLSSSVRVAPIGKIPVRCYIKGVTYHGLEVKEEDGVFSARVVFDI